MVVTPETGTLTAIGMKSKETYTVQFYSSDVIGARVLFAPQGAAGSTSDQFWRVPDKEGIIITRIQVATGQTVSTGANVTVNGAAINGGTLKWASVLETLATPQPFSVVVAAGQNLGMVQF